MEFLDLPTELVDKIFDLIRWDDLKIVIRINRDLSIIARDAIKRRERDVGKLFRQKLKLYYSRGRLFKDSSESLKLYSFMLFPTDEFLKLLQSNPYLWTGDLNMRTGIKIPWHWCLLSDRSGDVIDSFFIQGKNITKIQIRSSKFVLFTSYHLRNDAVKITLAFVIPWISLQNDDIIVNVSCDGPYVVQCRAGQLGSRDRVVLAYTNQHSFITNDGRQMLVSDGVITDITDTLSHHNE